MRLSTLIPSKKSNQTPAPGNGATTAEAPSSRKLTKAQPGDKSPQSLAANLPAPGTEARRPVGDRSISSPQSTHSGLDLENLSSHKNGVALSHVWEEAYNKPAFSINDAGFGAGHNNYTFRQFGNPIYGQKAQGLTESQEKAQPHHRSICFSGSKELPDWAHDANIRQVNVPGMGMVHAGFWEAYSSMKPSILASIGKTPEDKKVPMVIHGHSLGAATSVLAAYDLKKNGYNVVLNMTAGCPKPGGKDFAANYEKMGIPTNRYVNRNADKYDIVTQVPPGDFQHVGKAYYVSPQGLTDKEQKEHMTLNPLQFLMNPVAAKESVSSHHVPFYREHLQKGIDSDAVAG